MSSLPIKTALISVSDKTGIVEFAQGLAEMGITIISTGGTANLLKENGLDVKRVEQITGFPEILDGRVKTLHPKIFAAILADREDPDHMGQLREHGIEPIDMVVVNLYPFEETIAKADCSFEQAIEMIDIGGPCLLRAAAKNHRQVLVVSDPCFYQTTLTLLKDNQGNAQGSAADQRASAFDAFWKTTAYDATVSQWLGRNPDSAGGPSTRILQLRRGCSLRYGENPTQRGEAYPLIPKPHEASVMSTDPVCGEVALSFNNYVDADAALELCKELTRENRQKTSVFIKHTNPCGLGTAHDPVEAYSRAYLGDPSAALGGVLAQNSEVDVNLASAVMESLDRWGKSAGAGSFFVEVWVAPRFQQAAIDAIRSKKEWGKRARLLEVGDMSTRPAEDEMSYHYITGGALFQTRDVLGLNESDWKVATRRRPRESELADLRLAWLICKHTKSNAISICRDGMLIGNGVGQTSRMMSCRIATWLAQDNGHAVELQGAVAASDGFFPFRDGPDLLIQAGVRAIIQPGGSKRDAEVIAACDENDVSMILTGTRHFRH